MFFTLFIIPRASNGQALVNYGIHQDYVSTRALGMGNAFTAVCDDYSTMFYNPAGLGKLQSGTINMFINAGASSSFLPLYNDIKGISGSSNAQKTTSAMAVIDKHYGENYFSRFGLGGIWARPRWAVAVIPLDLELNMSIHQAIGPTLNVEANQVTTIAYAYGRPVKWSQRDDWYWGVLAKAKYRGYFNKNLSATELATSSELFRASEAKEGLGLDADLSLLYEPKVESGFFHTVAPSFSFVVRNVLDLGYKQNLHLINKESTEPPKSGRTFDFGSKWQLPKWSIFTVRGMLDIRDVGHRYWSPVKGVHVGAEFDWNIASWWRGGWRIGLNQGYWTAGFTGKFLAFMLDLASWGEEVGTKDSKQENRRYMLNASIDF